MKGIYRFYWDCGRSGELNGVFVADSVDVEKAIGREIYFGEVLGKHSEISGKIEANEIALVSDDPGDVQTFERLGLETGHNPITTLADAGEDEGGVTMTAVDN